MFLHNRGIYLFGGICKNTQIGLEGMTVTIGIYDNDLPVTTLVDYDDQAALQGLLRRLYSLGLPLISVICIAIEKYKSINIRIAQ